MYLHRRALLPVLVLYAATLPALFAHAILLSAVPAAKQVVHGPDVPIKLKFNSRIDAQRSRLTLVSAGTAQIALVIEKQEAPDELSAHAQGLKPGSYILRWQVLANDGHITRGEVPFQVQ
jgi:methionine-rich copper-binding protein CopC